MALLDSSASFLREIKQIILNARYNSYTAVNREMLQAYFEVGRKIVEEEQQGKERAEYGEKLLEIISKELIKEFGQGFSFVARQKRFTIDNDHFYMDLLFYNIYLRCYVVIELKTEKFRHADAGQMNFYLNYTKKELNKEEDNDPIGIILCTEKDSVQVEFATSGMSNALFVSKYKLYLPSKEELEKEVKKLL